jgi:hypothetical protein
LVLMSGAVLPYHVARVGDSVVRWFDGSATESTTIYYTILPMMLQSIYAGQGNRSSGKIVESMPTLSRVRM